MRKTNWLVSLQKRKKYLFVLVPILLILASCQQQTATQKKQKETVVEQRKQDDLIGKKLRKMTLQQKVMQMFIVEPEVITGSQTTTGKRLQEKLQKYPVSGFIFMGANIDNPTQLKTMASELKNTASRIHDIPLFLSIDEEGGTVARIGNNAKFQTKQIQNMKKIGESGDPNKAREVGDTIGEYLSEYGINLDFAPVGDVLTNEKNQVIGSRSFGKNPQLVAKMVNAECSGLLKQGVLPCIKHFPGHGATEGDTHLGFAITKKTLGELRKSELVPFQMASKERLPFIMVSHISVPFVTGSDIPSSLSYKMISTILRGELGYQGIIITDAMNMGAIQKNYKSETAAVKSVKAGVDIILMPQDFKKAYRAVMEAVKHGEISEERIDESVRRILEVKFKL